MTASSASRPGRAEVARELAWGALLGVLAAAVAALPAAWRVAALGQALFLGWLGLLGAAALVLGPLIALGRVSRGALRPRRRA